MSIVPFYQTLLTTQIQRAKIQVEAGPARHHDRPVRFMTSAGLSKHWPERIHCLKPPLHMAASVFTTYTAVRPNTALPSMPLGCEALMCADAALPCALCPTADTASPC
jgi:hypothetical protein